MGRVGFYFKIFIHGTIIPLFVVCSTFSQKPTNDKEVEELIWVKGGVITVGDVDDGSAQPLFTVEVKDFYMQRYEVSNNEFFEFINATDYVTFAEKQGGSYVFNPQREKDSLSIPNELWWYFQENANWKHPKGDSLDISEKLWYPVVHIAHEDAELYCAWKNMRLPTEIEWEYAARKNGNTEEKNFWQGIFPFENRVEDGFESIAPCGSFPSGKLGINDLQGNVWEWCADLFHENAYYYAELIDIDSSKPLVNSCYDSHFPNETTYVIRGGSFLCAENYCRGYELSKRMRSSSTMSFEHIGFRCVKNAEE